MSDDAKWVHDESLSEGPCDGCKGSGKCSHCNGTGKIGDLKCQVCDYASGECKVCNGTGRNPPTLY